MRKFERNLKAKEWLPILQRILTKKGINALSQPCQQYFLQNKRHFVGGIILFFLFSRLIHSTVLSTSRKIKELVPHGELEEYKEWHDLVVADSSAPLTTCTIVTPQHPVTAITSPFLVPSFPGGSSDLMRMLIESTTGYWTSARTYRDDVLAIKTHFPYYENHINPSNLPQPSDAQVIFVIRDPLDSMESWMTWIEQVLHKDVLRPSVQTWVDWRDDYYVAEIKTWELFLRYWLDKDHVQPSSRIILAYDNLMDAQAGPSETLEMVQFISRFILSYGLQPLVSPDDIPCLWKQVVQFQKSDIHDSSSQNSPESNTSNRNLREEQHHQPESIEDDRPYTFEQLDLAASILTELINDFSHEKKLITFLIKYRSKVLDKMGKLHRIQPIMVHNSLGRCMVTTPTYKEVTPVFAASYPGSGSEMVRDLVEAVTAIKTGDSYDQNNVITIKTSYPILKIDVKPGFWKRHMKRAILLVRNPLDAIYSNFNHIYASTHGVSPHSTEAPMDLWEQWRDENFEKEINRWIGHFEFWTSKFSSNNRLVISYESMIHHNRGPKEATRIALFLKGLDGYEDIQVAPTFTIPCLWFRAVKIYDEAKDFEAKRMASYTSHQLEMTATLLNNLYWKYNYELHLGPLIHGYWEDTVSRMHTEFSLQEGS